MIFGKSIPKHLFFPDPPTLVLKKTRETLKKTRVFLFAEPLKSLDSEGKRTKKQRKSEKGKEIERKKKQGLEGQGCNWNVFFREINSNKQIHAVIFSGWGVACYNVMCRLSDCPAKENHDQMSGKCQKMLINVHTCLARQAAWKRMENGPKPDENWKKLAKKMKIAHGPKREKKMAQKWHKKKGGMWGHFSISSPFLGLFPISGRGPFSFFDQCFPIFGFRPVKLISIPYQAAWLATLDPKKNLWTFFGHFFPIWGRWFSLATLSNVCQSLTATSSRKLLEKQF